MVSRFTLLLVALAAAGLASAVTALLVGGHAVGAAPLLPQAHLDPLIDELRTLNRRLQERLQAEAARPTPEQPVRAPAQDPALQVARLAASVDALVQELREAPPKPAAAIDPAVRAGPVRWQAVYDFARQHVADPDAARRSILFLTPREVVQRFGIPTESGSGKGSMWMVYRQEDEGGNALVNVYLSFADGIVMFHETELGGQ